jgi:hypothetical protein
MGQNETLPRLTFFAFLAGETIPIADRFPFWQLAVAIMLIAHVLGSSGISIIPVCKTVVLRRGIGMGVDHGEIKGIGCQKRFHQIPW